MKDKHDLSNSTIIILIGLIVLSFIQEICSFISKIYTYLIVKVIIFIVFFIFSSLIYLKLKKTQKNINLLSQIIKIKNKRSKLIVMESSIILLSMYKVAVKTDLIGIIELILSNSIFLILFLFDEKKTYYFLAEREDSTPDLKHEIIVDIWIVLVLLDLYILFDFFKNFRVPYYQTYIVTIIFRKIYFLVDILTGGYAIYFISLSNNYVLLFVLKKVGVFKIDYKGESNKLKSDKSNIKHNL